MNTIIKTFLSLAILFPALMFAQDANIRGSVIDNTNGEPVIFTNVILEGTTLGASTDINGFFSIPNIEAGDYVIVVTYVGYETAKVPVTVKAGEILNKTVYLDKSKGVDLEVINVSASKQESKSEVQVSAMKLTPKQINQIPAAGGDADLSQFLQVVPGVVFTGDQGGQLYIRGGSPVQNKILLDGMDIYNPFHSIGFFSVFETDILRNVDILTGGFNAEYGGRLSAVLDVTTRDGNKKRFGGKVSASPFLAKAIIEAPIRKLDEKGNSMSFILTGKHSYLDKTSKALYEYANPNGLPYSFTDLYGKFSINSGNGSKMNLFGFNYNNKVTLSEIANLEWNALGFGTNFKLVPSSSKMIIGGTFAYSQYSIDLQEGDGQPRKSDINAFQMDIDFTYFIPNGEFKYGFEINGGKTNFEFFNSQGIIIGGDPNNTTEIATYFKFRKSIRDKLVLEPSVRAHFYASLGEFSFEPRLGLKYNLTDKIRLKFAGGLFSQNLISANNENDVVSLFNGYLSGPDQTLTDINGDKATSKLQKSVHAIAGLEVDIAKGLSLNVEPYLKYFNQLITINRNKTKIGDSDYQIETGEAKGIDFLLKYQRKNWFLWGAYSLGSVERNDGNQVYYTHFDRRHNVNLVGSYTFGKNLDWEASLRWNLGSGFPFTQTQAFYEYFPFTDGIDSDYITENGELGTLFDTDRNEGRLPYYHRLDASIKKKFVISDFSELELNASVTNVYDRENIFYFDRVRYTRVNQLPIMPSFSASFKF